MIDQFFILQVKTPMLTYVINTKSLYINRTILKLCKSVRDGVVTQFMLHHVLNLQYCDGKSNYYTFLEILSGISLAEDSIKDNCALKTFLQKYGTG